MWLPFIITESGWLFGKKNVILKLVHEIGMYYTNDGREFNHIDNKLKFFMKFAAFFMIVTCIATGCIAVVFPVAQWNCILVGIYLCCYGNVFLCSLLFTYPNSLVFNAEPCLSIRNQFRNMCHTGRRRPRWNWTKTIDKRTPVIHCTLKTWLWGFKLITKSTGTYSNIQ